MKRLYSILILAFFSSAAQAAPMTEQQKIDALLGAFDTPGITFIRNGEEHDGAWAKQHLADKMKEAKPEITTAEDFISKIASKSRQTGKPYLIKTKDGKTIKSATWLHAKLAGMAEPASGSKDDSMKK